MAVNLEMAEFANEAFYLAFEAKDYDAMAHLWSREREVVCLHPGWPALIGRDKVMESWRSILSNPQQGQVSFYAASCITLSADTVLVVCYEQAAGTVMVASNIFAEEDNGLRLISHQAGYCANPPAADA
ncbi:MAG: nuclear transport factor 2 family protein [Pseudomonadota bacterium]